MDLERDLTARGRKQAESLGRWMLGNGIMPALIFSSPAQRARATARICSEAAGYQGSIRYKNDLYDGHGNAYVTVMTDLVNKYDSVMIVGHNPEISDVITFFTGEPLVMAPCRLVCLEFAVEEWDAIQDSNGILKWAQTPPG